MVARSKGWAIPAIFGSMSLDKTEQSDSKSANI
jgi:hypothetical protein